MSRIGHVMVILLLCLINEGAKRRLQSVLLKLIGAWAQIGRFHIDWEPLKDVKNKTAFDGQVSAQFNVLGEGR